MYLQALVTTVQRFACCGSEERTQLENWIRPNCVRVRDKNVAQKIGGKEQR